jgi:hypothetical protein
MRSNSAVGVVWSIVGGESISADGDGRDVRYGFCARAADKAAFEAGGVTRVMSRKSDQLGNSESYTYAGLAGRA